MSVNLFSFVGMYVRAVDTAQHLLDKGAAFAAEKGVPEAEMLAWRLYPDMFTLLQQFQIVIKFPQQWLARAAGLPEPGGFDTETTVAELKAALANTRAWLGALKPEQFEGRDDVPMTADLGMVQPTLPSGQWVTGFATTNILFHLSIAYGILRHNGVPLGKVDLFAGGL